MSQAFVTRRMLRWARQRRNVSQAEIAKRIGTSPDRISAWENDEGKDYPTLRQAQKFAGAVHIPFGYLYLSQPPVIATPLPDLRTVSGTASDELSPDFLDQLHDVLRKQNWYRDYQERREALDLEFVGRFTVDDAPEVIARDMVKVLGISEEMRHQASSWQHFLTLFVRRAEAVGVLVFRSGVVGGNPHRPLSVKEFRGFAISDKLAPAIFINSKDAKAAQTFTLAHELAHLWIGESGISNPDYKARPGDQPNTIDRLCDKVTTEVLVPEAEFLSRWRAGHSIQENLQRLASHYRVSRFVVLRRAFEVEAITQQEFWQHYDELMDDSHQVTGEGGDFYNLLLSRNSPTLTFTLVSLAIEGRLPRRDAARLLNVKVGTIEKIRRELMGGSAPDD